MIHRIISPINVIVLFVVALVCLVVYMCSVAVSAEERACQTGDTIIAILQDYKDQHGCYPAQFRQAVPANGSASVSRSSAQGARRSGNGAQSVAANGSVAPSNAHTCSCGGSLGCGSACSSHCQCAQSDTFESYRVVYHRSDCASFELSLLIDNDSFVYYTTSDSLWHVNSLHEE